MATAVAERSPPMDFVKSRAAAGDGLPALRVSEACSALARGSSSMLSLSGQPVALELAVHGPFADPHGLRYGAPIAAVGRKEVANMPGLQVPKCRS